MGKLRVLDLFSGVGGFSLGLERAGGFETVAFCEIEPFCRRVLAKHWPHVPCYEDVRTLTAERLEADGIAVDVICGGFPCQDISAAGKGAGIDGERSGLWREYARLIAEVRPAFVIVENVPALRSRGADRVLSDLEAVGYAGEPALVGAVHAGAPHRRQRTWIIAYAIGEHDDDGRYGAGSICGNRPTPSDICSSEAVADALRDGWIERRTGYSSQSTERGQPYRSCVGIDPNGSGLAIQFNGNAGQFSPSLGSCGEWSSEPDVGRVAHGVPSRVDRLRALGNAVVPQIPEIIGRAILASMQTEAA